MGKEDHGRGPREAAGAGGPAAVTLLTALSAGEKAQILSPAAHVCLVLEASRAACEAERRQQRLNTPQQLQQQQQQYQQLEVYCCCCCCVPAALLLLSGGSSICVSYLWPCWTQPLPPQRGRRTMVGPPAAAAAAAVVAPSGVSPALTGPAAGQDRKGGGYYFATSLPPTVVSCCCSVKLRSPSVPTLVLARPRSLVFLHPAAAEGSSSSSGSSPAAAVGRSEFACQAYSALGTAGLEAAGPEETEDAGSCEGSLFFCPPVVLPCKESVSALAAVPRRPLLSVHQGEPADERHADTPQQGFEDLLLLTESQSLLLFTYCKKRRTIVPTQSIDLRLPCFRRLKGRPVLAVCPLSGDIVIHQYEFRLQYLRRRRAGNSSSSSSSGAEGSRAKRVKEHEEQRLPATSAPPPPQQQQDLEEEATHAELEGLPMPPLYDPQRVLFVNEMGILEVAFVYPEGSKDQQWSSSSSHRRRSSSSWSKGTPTGFSAASAARSALSRCRASGQQCQLLCCLFEAAATSSSCAGAPLAAAERFVRLLHVPASAKPFLNTEPVHCSCGDPPEPVPVAQGASRLLSLPPYLGGLLVCSPETISWFVPQEARKSASALSSSSSSLLNRGSHASPSTAGGLVLLRTEATFPGCDDIVSVVLLNGLSAAVSGEQQQQEQTCAFLAADLKGRVLQGVLRNSDSSSSSSSGSCVSLSLSFLGQACEAPQLAALGPRTFFAASTCSDNLVLEVLDPGVDDVCSSSCSSSSSSSIESLSRRAEALAAGWVQQQHHTTGQQGDRLRVLETLANLGPIVDCCIVDFEGRGQRQLAVCCGSGRSGAIRFVRDGLFLHSAGKVALEQPVEGLWCLRLQQAGARLLLAAVSMPRRTALLEWRQQQPTRGDVDGGVCEARRWGEEDGAIREIVELGSGLGGFVSSEPSLLCSLFLAAPDAEEEAHMQADGGTQVSETNDSNVVVLQVLARGMIALEAVEASLAFRAAVSLEGIAVSSSGAPCLRLQPCSSGEALCGSPPAAAAASALLISAASVAPVGELKGLFPFGDVLLVTSESAAATVSLRGSSFHLWATKQLGSEASAAHAARLDVGDSVASDAREETLAGTATAAAAGFSVGIAAIGLFGEGTVQLLSLPALEPVMTLDAFRGDLGVWVVSTLVARLGAVLLCCCGLSNGRVIVFRLDFAVAAKGDSCLIKGTSRTTGATVSLQVSLLSGRVVHMGGGGPVRLVALPRLRPPPSSRRKQQHHSSSRRGSQRERGDTGRRGSFRSSLTYNHVPCVSLQLAADFSCEATDPLLGLLWVEGIGSQTRPASAASNTSANSSRDGWVREGVGGQQGVMLHVGVRERGQRLHSRVLPLGRTVDALCPIEAAGVVALACPAEIVNGREEPSCVLFVDPLTRAVEGRFRLPHPNYVPSSLCLGPPQHLSGVAVSGLSLPSLLKHEETAKAGAVRGAGFQSSAASSTVVAEAAAAPSDGDTSAALLCVGTAEVVLSDCEPLHGGIHVLRVSRVHGMLLVSEAAAPLQLSAGVHELRLFDGMILAACNHQATRPCACLHVCPQLKLFDLKYQAGDPADDAPLARRSHKHPRRYHHQQQQQQRRRDAGTLMDLIDEAEGDSLAPWQTETAGGRPKGLGSLGRLSLHLVAAFSASTFIASLDILDNRMICVGDMIASACLVEWRPAEKALREVARDMRCAWPLGVSLLSPDDCLMSDGEQNLWVLQRACPEGASKVSSVSREGDGQQRSAAADAAALRQQQQEEDPMGGLGGGSTGREQQRQQQQGSNEWASRGAAVASVRPLSDAQHFRLSPCAALHTPVSVNKLIHGGISFRLEEGCLVNPGTRQQLLAPAASGAPARAGGAEAAAAAAAETRTESLGMLMQSAHEGSVAVSAAQRGDSSSSSRSSLMRQQRKCASLCLPSFTRTWVSAEGSIGVVLKLNDEETFARLSLLEEAVGDIMDCIGSGCGYSAHGARRDGSWIPYKGFIDGDSLEQLLLLRPSEQREVYKLARATAEEAGVSLPSLEELLLEVEQLRQLH
ncbi:hypothetical protein Esti_000640 [Eimeria stiedai]